jgi:capsid portal protein
MGKIIINRSHEFSNYLRAVEIHLDHKKIGEIKNGESKNFEVDAGKYVLKAKIDWCTSNEIHLEIGSGETLRYNLAGRNPFFGLYYVTFGRKKYLNLKQIP